MNVNSVTFTPEEVEKGFLQDLLKYLTDHNEKSNDYYYEIHVTSDGYCSIVEFVRVPYDDSLGGFGKFEYIDEDHVVVKEVILPDNSTVFAYNEEHEKELLDEFLEENPWYKKNEWGRWYDEREGGVLFNDTDDEVEND